MPALKQLLDAYDISQGDVAAAVGISRTSLNKFINEGRELKTIAPEELRRRIERVLVGKGIASAVIARAFNDPGAAGEGAAARGNARQPDQTRSGEPEALEESADMLLRKQSLFPATRRHFGLFRDPFTDDVTESDDVFCTPDIRYVREAMWQTARHGGFLAVVGESGAGKSTLRRDLIDRIQTEAAPVLVVEPYVLGMEENDNAGKTLKAGHIAEAILSTVAPLERPKSSPEARFRQIHQRLRDSRRAGHQHVLVIEEAHGMNVNTLKHLKRFHELEDGFQRLLSIILIGQPELKMKLSERNPEVREVTQRCEIAELTPLGGQLEEYLAFKFRRIGADLGKLFDAGAIDALREKLTYRPNSPRRAEQAANEVSLLFPLAIHNVVTAALNLAAELGQPQVVADTVREV